MKRAKHNAHHAAMSDHGYLLILRENGKMTYFIDDPLSKICERFSARREQMGEYFDPPICIRWIESLYLTPGKAFPVAEVNFAQGRPLS